MGGAGGSVGIPVVGAPVVGAGVGDVLGGGVVGRGVTTVSLPAGAAVGVTEGSGVCGEPEGVAVGDGETLMNPRIGALVKPTGYLFIYFFGGDKWGQAAGILRKGKGPERGTKRS